MCGIVGVFGLEPAEAGRKIVERMNATIVHRGPDDAGVWSIDGAAVAMRRLSIIDLAGGHQPMVADNGVVIVFNGEIYNYRALRRELQDAGCVFKTTSDTEVVLQLYCARGLEGLKRLEGMYGICIVDPGMREAHLIRDRVGIKPLYYGIENGKFYFASEIKAILAGMQARPEPDLEAIYHYLTLRFVPTPGTVWKDIYKLEPGHTITYRLDDGSWAKHRYWTFDFAADPMDAGRDYESEFQKLFLDAVGSHLMTADVPVGILLSGGIDSSAVAAATVELGVKGLKTFSVAFDDGGKYSELEFAREVAAHIGAEHFEVTIGQKEFLDFLEGFVWHADEPLADLASIPLYYVSKLAQEHVKVVLSGEGADEIFAGYDNEKLAAEADRRERYLSSVPRMLFSLAARFSKGDRAATLREMGTHGWSAYLKAWAAYPTDHWSEDKKALLWRGPVPATDTRGLIQSFYDATDFGAPLDQYQQVSCGDWLVEDLLMKADKMTMARSIELRVPFLEQNVVEWAKRLPVHWRVGSAQDGYVSKRILRSFAKQRLPSRIVGRPKRGFPVPAYEWLRGDLGQWAQSRLLGSGGRLADWVNLAELAPTLEAARAGSHRAAHQIWALIVLDAWARRWL